MYYINLTCFLCLKEIKNNEVKISSTDKDGNTVKNKLKICVPELVEEDMTDSICLNCSKQINASFNFKNKCLQNKGRLKGYKKMLQQKDFIDDSFQSELNILVMDAHNLGFVFKNEKSESKNEDQFLPDVPDKDNQYNDDINTDLNKVRKTPRSEICRIKYFFTSDESSDEEAKRQPRLKLIKRVKTKKDLNLKKLPTKPTEPKNKKSSKDFSEQNFNYTFENANFGSNFHYFDKFYNGSMNMLKSNSSICQIDENNHLIEKDTIITDYKTFC